MGTHAEAIGDSAIRVLAEKGAKGFTHRAVDQHAGLPEGTTSRYARSREALFQLVSHALFRQDRQATVHAPRAEPPADANTQADGQVDIAESLVKATLGLMDAPERFLARVELQLEARRSPDVHRQLLAHRALFVAGLAAALKRRKVASPQVHADLLIVMVDGVLNRQIVLGEAPLSRTQLKGMFSAYLASITPY